MGIFFSLGPPKGSPRLRVLEVEDVMEDFQQLGHPLWPPKDWCHFFNRSTHTHVYMMYLKYFSINNQHDNDNNSKIGNNSSNRLLG